LANKEKDLSIRLNQRRQNDNYKEWLHNKANTKISDRQTSKEMFRRGINRSDFMKSDKDENIAQRCADRQKNVQSREQFKHASSCLV